MKRLNINEKRKFYAALLICLSLYLTHFFFVLRYAVNIPFYDEWEEITPSGFIADPTFSHLFAQHNEHRIITTKFLTLLLYEIDDWNLITHQAVNFVIYGLLLCLTVYIIKKCVPQLPSWVLLCFIVFLLSTAGYENFSWAFQTQFHFSLIFLLPSVYFLFNEKQSLKNLLLGIFFSWATIYSFSSGLIEIIVTLIAYAFFKLLRFYRHENKHKKMEIKQLFICLISIFPAIGFYFIDYEKPPHPLIFPDKKEFWIYFFNLLSGGFGYKSAALLPGIIIFLFILTPIIGEIWNKKDDLPSGNWVIIVLILSILGALFTISMGRAGLDMIAWSKSSRYAEVVELLIPLSIAMWAIFLRQKENLRDYLLLASWLFFMIGFAKYWNIPKTYHDVAQQRQQGVECVKNYYHHIGDGNCPTIYPAPIAERLDYGKTLNLSFVYENTK